MVDKGRIKLITKVKDDFVLTFKNLFKEFLRLHCKFHRVKIIVHKNSLQTILMSKDTFGVKLREVIDFYKNQPNILLNKKINYTLHVGVQFEILLKMMVAVSPGIKELNGKGKSIRRGKAVLKKNPKVSIIIPAWNRWEFTKACLSSVFNITNYKNYEVIVVDNGSKDYTPIGLKEFVQKYDNLKIITNSYNMGTASAKDKGAQYSSGKYLMFIDNDTCPNDPDWLDIMIETINYHPKIGACGLFGVICLSDDNNLIQVQRILVPNIIIPIDWCAGYCIMIRREAMIDSGEYRGDLFKLVDGEDIHIGYALRNKGWAIVNIPIDLDIRRIEDSHIKEIDGIPRTTIRARNDRVFGVEWGPRKRLLNNFESNRTIDELWSKEKQGFCE